MFQYLLSGKIFRADTEDLRLDPEQDILCDKNHLLLAFSGKSEAHLQYPVIHHLCRQFLRQLYIHKIFFYPKRSSAFKRHAAEHVSFLSELFQTADAPAGICSDFPFRLFQMIQLFQHDHGQHYGIVLKMIDGIGRLDQNVRIQHINFNHMISLSDLHSPPA